MNRSEMIEKLVDGKCKVIFTKKDGTERTMICTLNGDVIPAEAKSDPSTKKDRAVNEQVLPVWDCESKGWRSFRVDSVVSFSHE